MTATTISYLVGRKMYVCQAPNGDVLNSNLLDEKEAFVCAVLVNDTSNGDDNWICYWQRDKQLAFNLADYFRQEHKCEAMVVEIETVTFVKGNADAEDENDHKKDFHPRRNRRGFEELLQTPR